MIIEYSTRLNIVQDNLFLMLFCDDIERQKLKWRNQDVSSYNDIINCEVNNWLN